MTGSLSDVDDVARAIAEVDQRIGEVFTSTAGMLDLPGAVRQRWAMQCRSFIDSGWTVSASALAFIHLSRKVAEQADGEALVDMGDYALRIHEVSVEPCLRYLSGLHELCDGELLADRMHILDDIERLGDLIRRTRPYAVTLLARYFEVSMDLVRHWPEKQVRAWIHLVGRMSEEDHGDLARLMDLGSVPGPWDEPDFLDRISPRACLTLLECWQELMVRPGRVMVQGMQPALVRAAGEGALSELLDTLVHLENGHSEIRYRLPELLDDLPDTGLLVSFLRHFHQLPLQDMGLLRQWVIAGVQEAGNNREAGAAWFSLESARSLDRLAELSNQVHFRDCRTVLQLYAKAMSGRKMNLEPLPEGTDSYRDSGAEDGYTVYLPESVSGYGSGKDNFGFYKISILHQAGYFEFGTYAASARVKSHLDAFRNTTLSRMLFRLLEEARIDWQLEKTFRGVVTDLQGLKRTALASRKDRSLPGKSRWLEALVRWGLDDADVSGLGEQERMLCQLMDSLKEADASVMDTLRVTASCYRIMDYGDVPGGLAEEETLDDPLPVPWRGELHTGRLAAFLLEESAELTEAEMDDDLSGPQTPVALEGLDIQEAGRGETGEVPGEPVTELADPEVEQAEEQPEKSQDRLEWTMAGTAGQSRKDVRFLYDEWDSGINDYRPRWCTLFEIRELEPDPGYVDETIAAYPEVVRRVHRQLNRLKPEMLRKVKGVVDGDELDLERAVSAVVDRKSGQTPSEHIYIQRQRRDRDVSALFLLDMSASTDDLIPGEEPDRFPENVDEDELDLTLAIQQTGREEGDRIIDLEKQSVIMMADALEELGDSYAICGFSGYGRERVDYFLCKDFDESWDDHARGRVGGIKPCRSTRMGPAVRHATRSLMRTESRIKALIVISDGYPQDFDYGRDRNSRDYGVRDTMMAISEARKQGVQCFCLTVDPSGHDYLREMCRDDQYMVIQDITQLPDELSKVYRSLTG